MGRGNKSLFMASGSHDQDGCHGHNGKILQKSSPEAAVSISLTYFMASSNYATFAFI